MSRKGMRTYSHLEPLKRKPSDYEIATSQLLYHPQRGFEVNVPVAAWYEKYQRGSPVQCSDWERFRDPRETTYTKYTGLQAAQETFVEGLLRAAADSGHDARLPAPWLDLLDRVLAPLRYPVHGLQMAAAYVGQMAPAGRITITALMQSADEIRRIQWLAYRTAQLGRARAGFGQQARRTWETDPLWQPLRETIERLLVTYDAAEALVALNFAVKPAFDEAFMSGFARLAHAHRDDFLQKLFFSLGEDCRWHRAWSDAWLRLVLADRTENRAIVEQWLERWRPLAARAVEPFLQLEAESWVGAEAPDVRGCLDRLEQEGRERVTALAA